MADSSYLVISDGISQLLDESSQGFGIVGIAQELEKCMLFGEWFKFYNNPFKLPKMWISKPIRAHMSTDLRSTDLLHFSA